MSGVSYVILGDIGLAGLVSPVDMREDLEVIFAEHEIIDGKTLLQFTGEQADNLDLTCWFHADFCNPDAVWSAMKAMLRGHDSFLVLTGAGMMLGRYVLVSLAKVTTWAADDGTVLAFECNLRLREYAVVDALQSRIAIQRKSAPGVAGNRGGIALKSTPPVTTTGDSGSAIARMA
jgi:phage protein U